MFFQQFFLHLTIFVLLLANSIWAQQLQNAVKGKKCAKDQFMVVNKLTVYEDGAIEAECGPLPCGSTASTTCLEEMSSCKASLEVFSGMKWAQNGQSLLLRCCAMRAANKVYIGTDLVTMGSYYTGGLVPEQDLTTPAGKGAAVEYDFVANARTEQGGVRIWVHRVVCGGGGGAKRTQQPAEASESNDGQAEHKFSDAQHAPSAVSPAQNVVGAVAASAVDPAPVTEEQHQHQHQQQQQQQQPHEVPTTDDELEQAQNPLQYRPRSNRRRIRMASTNNRGDGQ